MDHEATLHDYFRRCRADLLAKLDGLSEYDDRRPMTPTGTNLLGLLKHVASVELGYFGDTFGRPAGRELPWFADGAEPDADMWASAEESREEIVELYEFAGAHADATIEALPLDAPGDVPWWAPEKRRVTLQQILVHMTVETARHAGHADIVRELIDGERGRYAGDASVSHRDDESWATYRARLEEAAQRFR